MSGRLQRQWLQTVMTNQHLNLFPQADLAPKLSMTIQFPAAFFTYLFCMRSDCLFQRHLWVVWTNFQDLAVAFHLLESLQASKWCLRACSVVMMCVPIYHRFPCTCRYSCRFTFSSRLYSPGGSCERKWGVGDWLWALLMALAQWCLGSSAGWSGKMSHGVWGGLSLLYWSSALSRGMGRKPA